MHDVAQLIAELPCSIFAVQLDKRHLPDHVGSEDMYRFTLSRLLELLDADLQRIDQPGMLLIDARSTLHSAVQDRRLLDAYCDWLASRSGHSRFLDLPWFGFSSFYDGLQLADFSAYLIDFVSNEHQPGFEDSELQRAYRCFSHKVILARVP